MKEWSILIYTCALLVKMLEVAVSIAHMGLKDV